MIKAIILLKRNDGTSLNDFSDWMLNKHAPLALELEGLRKYEVNIATDPDGDYDGINELWFDSEEDMLAAYGSEHGQSVAADSLARVKTRIRVLVDEHSFTPGG